MPWRGPRSRYWGVAALSCRAEARSNHSWILVWMTVTLRISRARHGAYLTALTAWNSFSSSSCTRHDSSCAHTCPDNVDFALFLSMSLRSRSNCKLFLSMPYIIWLPYHCC